MISIGNPCRRASSTDLIVSLFDPPRAGAEANRRNGLPSLRCQSLLRCRVRPATLARDARVLLIDGGYEDGASD